MKKVYSFVVNSTPSTCMYTTRVKAVKAAKRVFERDFISKDLSKIRGTDFYKELSLGDNGAIDALVYVDAFVVR